MAGSHIKIDHCWIYGDDAINGAEVSYYLNNLVRIVYETTWDIDMWRHSWRICPCSILFQGYNLHFFKAIYFYFGRLNLCTVHTLYGYIPILGFLEPGCIYFPITILVKLLVFMSNLSVTWLCKSCEEFCLHLKDRLAELLILAIHLYH